MMQRFIVEFQHVLLCVMGEKQRLPLPQEMRSAETASVLRRKVPSGSSIFPRSKGNGSEASAPDVGFGSRSKS